MKKRAYPEAGTLFSFLSRAKTKTGQVCPYFLFDLFERIGQAETPTAQNLL